MIDSNFFHETFHFDLSNIDEKGTTSLVCSINVDTIDRKGNRVNKTFVNDNFNLGKSVKKELEFFLNDDENLFPNYYQGDLHYHSNYTKDQVEFGAPLSITKECGKSLDLKFTLITDHSYDLDDMEDDYLKKDPLVKQFHSMKKECKDLSDDNFKLINSEEVTVKNSRDRNVHLIVASEEKFFHGTGDDAENWLETTSENRITEVLEKIADDSLAIAAHPFVKTPFLEGLLIKRGEWNKKDVLKAYNESKMNLIQILNGELDEGFFLGLKIWIELLLESNKIFIVAGNDAHGNFSSFRQIEVPMMKMVKKSKQLFGKCRTVVLGESSSSVNIISDIRKGSCYITNGPHIDFYLSFRGKDFRYGDNIVISDNNIINAVATLKINSSIFSGSIRSIRIFCGNLIEKKEFIIYEDKIENNDLYNEEKSINLFDFEFDRYYRVEIETFYEEKNEIKMALSNPIWVSES